MTKTKMIYVPIESDKYDRIRTKCKNCSIANYVRNLIDKDLIGSDQNQNIENVPIPSNKENDPIRTNDPIITEQSVWDSLSI